MTQLSINLNKIALLRNSRGQDFPNVVDFARKFLQLGVHGITIHPRPDERHIRRQDAFDLAAALGDHPGVELNIEGYPGADFLDMVTKIRPAQCTLVPDSPAQLTSDQGWDLMTHGNQLGPTLQRLADVGVRSALFVSPDCEQIERAAEINADRIELYTEWYARCRAHEQTTVLQSYRQAAERARQVGLGVNAGHDLNLRNLPRFLSIDNILEVSIGHAVTVECIEQGMVSVIAQYLQICEA